MKLIYINRNAAAAIAAGSARRDYERKARNAAPIK